MENKNNITRFLDWVNADDNLPSREELDHGHGDHDDHDDHDDHGDHDGHGDHGDHDDHGGHDDHGDHDSHDDHGGHDDHGDSHAAEGSGDADDVVQVLESEDDELAYPDAVLPPEEDTEVDLAGTKAPDYRAPAEAAPVAISKKLKQQWQSFRLFYAIASCLLAVGISVALLVTVAYLPKFGSPENPTVNEVYVRYVEKGTEETGAVNTVAGMILDYRAFDTLGESFVLFTAMIAVIMLIRVCKDAPDSNDAGKVGNHESQA